MANPTQVERITFVPFLKDGRVALIRDDSGRLSLPGGQLLPREDVSLGAALRIPLETAGFRYQHFHPLTNSDGNMVAWIEGDRYAGTRPHAEADLTILEPAEAVQALIQSGRSDLADIVEEAARSFGSITDDEYLAESVELLEAAYLSGDTPQAGSGSGGDAADWIAGRRHIADAIDRDGSFIDFGCANGYLMECITEWTTVRGLRVEPYGVDAGARLVELARSRLPQWRDRIWHGNALDWVHPAGLRFDFVHALLDFVRPHRRQDLVSHLLDDIVAPGGRLIMSNYVDPATSSEPGAAEILARLGFDVAGETTPPPGRTAPSAWIVRS